MITGYNTDIRHGNRVFHVQTEDNGVSNPSIVTLIYVGGEILASKKTSYADATPLDEKKISELMENQHRRMIAAIRRGRFDGPTLPKDPLDDDTDVSKAPPMISTTAIGRRTADLPRATTGLPPAPSATPRPAAVAPMTPPAPSAVPPPRPPAPAPIPVLPPPVPAPPRPVPPASTATPPVVARPPFPAAPRPPLATEAPAPIPAPAAPATPTPPAIPPRPPVPKPAGSISISDRTLDQVIIDYLANESQNEHLELSLLSGGDVFAGEQVELRVFAKTAVAEEPIVGAEIVVKVISTVEKAVIPFRGKTTGDGTCICRFRIPDCREGNAAVIVIASSPHGNDELKLLVKRRR